MASIWYRVEALDFSETAINQIKERCIKNNIKNIKAKVCNILELDFKINHDIVWIINFVSLLNREKALDFIYRLKNKVSIWTYIILTWYLKEDILYKDNREGLFFEKKELLKIFWDFDVQRYKENFFIDEPHEWYYYKHRHAFWNIIARKK